MKYWREPLDLKDVRVPHGEIHVLAERCKGCGYCVEFCPRGVLEMTKELNLKGYTLAAVAAEGKCLGCGLCSILCPEFAVHVEFVVQVG